MQRVYAYTKFILSSKYPVSQPIKRKTKVARAITMFGYRKLMADSLYETCLLSSIMVVVQVQVCLIEGIGHRT